MITKNNYCNNRLGLDNKSNTTIEIDAKLVALFLYVHHIYFFKQTKCCPVILSNVYTCVFSRKYYFSNLLS